MYSRHFTATIYHVHTHKVYVYIYTHTYQYKFSWDDQPASRHACHPHIPILCKHMLLLALLMICIESMQFLHLNLFYSVISDIIDLDVHMLRLLSSQYDAWIIVCRLELCQSIWLHCIIVDFVQIIVVPEACTIVFKKNGPPSNYKFQIHNIGHARLLEAPVHKMTQWNHINMLYFEIKYVHRCGKSDSIRACHAAGPGSIPGRDKFPGWGFFGVFPHL